ncbi:MAG TPA: hypothetical protein VFS20_11585 [Longimicrobium sp.]|nr:hypothetical protein [Longimicrobium sp.]
MPGDAAPPALAEDASGRPVVTWIMRGEDYLGCQTAARDLRQIQQRYGDGVRLSLVYVGENPEWAAAFFRRERVAAPVRQLSRAEFRRTFGGLSLPAFYVTAGGRITARAASPDGVVPPPGAREIVERAVAAAMSGR